jgi:hypothetical protein
MQKDCRNNRCQRFGSKLNLNVHLHVLALDGAYTFEHGKARFHRAPARHAQARPKPEDGKNKGALCSKARY